MEAIVYTRSQLVSHPLTEYYMQQVWLKFTAGTFRGDLIFLFAHLISWFLYMTFRHASESLVGPDLANLAALVMLLIVIMSFVAIVFRSHKIKTVFKSRWEVYCKVGHLFSTYVLNCIQKTQAKLNTDEKALKDVLLDKEAIPNAKFKATALEKEMPETPSETWFAIITGFAWILRRGSTHQFIFNLYFPR